MICHLCIAENKMEIATIHIFTTRWRFAALNDQLHGRCVVVSVLLRVSLSDGAENLQQNKTQIP